MAAVQRFYRCRRRRRAARPARPIVRSTIVPGSGTASSRPSMFFGGSSGVGGSLRVGRDDQRYRHVADACEHAERILVVAVAASERDVFEAPEPALRPIGVNAHCAPVESACCKSGVVAHIVQGSVFVIVRWVPAPTYPGSKSTSSPAPIVVRPRQAVTPPNQVISYTPAPNVGRPNEKLACPDRLASVPGGEPSQDSPVIGPAALVRGNTMAAAKASAGSHRTLRPPWDGTVPTHIHLASVWESEKDRFSVP